MALRLRRPGTARYCLSRGVSWDIAPQSCEPRSKLLAWRRDIDLGVIVFLVSPIVLQIKPNVRIRLSGLGLLHGWEILEVLGSSTTLVLEMPRLGSWLDCAWL